MIKRYFTGLCMCWGNFCFIPGLKWWDEKARSLMLGWLPTVGLAIGLVWSLVYFGMVYASLPYLLVSFIMAFLPFILSGFMHVDGFMDCNDALLSRGDLEKKQRILKDSTCGTFAIITMIFTVLCFYSCLGSAISYGIDFVNLIAIAVISRSVSGLEVLGSKPMEVSQYVRMHEDSKVLSDEADSKEETGESEKPKIKEEKVNSLSAGYDLGQVEAVKDTEIGEYASISKAASEEVAFEAAYETESEKEEGDVHIESTGTEEKKDDSKDRKPATIRQGVVLLTVQLVLFIGLLALCCKYYLATAIVAVATALGTLISCSIAKKNLGGMNGDIAGYGIVWGEMMGVVALSVI